MSWEKVAWASPRRLHCANTSQIGTPLLAADLTAAYERIDDLAAAVELLASHDLVVNATGGVAVTVALDHAAEILDKPVVTVATTQEGRVSSVWIAAPGVKARSGWTIRRYHRPAYRPSSRTAAAALSALTPPWAVTLAASYGARTVVCLLTGQPAPVSYVQTVSVGLPPEAATC